ncbi:4-(cytidine 5'-diphospho)-2-C-methyl-D-erythritol kinase [Campylobacter vulpis]|uniref:4-(cytidine 5'-diphospho)-2-C-methyl-D-erythritol kinase n=1 Tax=Campylobacter vulpis TaxID=1655500 RepID=UPI001BCE1228|nr:4-(cytidine 5'-diphospho)-2-C-methyl-D-erythritol kinase [Campylobacter vulpis]MBS4234849.1 4-(cytidine 5'-diphospho)-2-C-methyl-D-erythritol kinase [Campylobacter vulpis]MBS4268379.1 4-(cytidine 5'-diphospho)-2-C-methyl-D-erythritol kinase [Campylobacter vulpis]
MKAYAKVNIFLKIIGLDERGYHLLSSRFVLLDTLYDELFLSNEKQKEGFELISDFKCENNIIDKAYRLLCEEGFENELKEFFNKKSLKLIKNIPTCAGLGGGSSDAAAFLRLINEELNLKISKEKMLRLSVKLGSDLAFFLSGVKSANVKGCGEVIEEFDDELVPFELHFPNIACETAKVYEEFDKKVFDFSKALKDAQIYEKLNTKELLEYENLALNDLFKPCVRLYPKMSEFLETGYFLSGSGSSVFKAKI